MRYACKSLRLMGAVALALLTTACPLNPPQNVEVTITPETPTVEVGHTLALTATSTDPSDKAFAWSSSAYDVAGVHPDGRVVAFQLGTVTVSARGEHSNASDSTEVTVTPPVGFNMTLPADAAKVAPKVATDATLEQCVSVVSIPGVAAAVECQEGRAFHHLQMQTAGYTEEEGRPRLPFIEIDYAIPLETQTQKVASWQVAVESTSARTYTGIVPYPSQPPAWLDDLSSSTQAQKEEEEESPAPDRPGLAIDEDAYKDVDPYPGPSYATETYQIGDLSVLRVRLYPVQYRAAQQTLEVAREMTVDVRFAGPNGVTQPLILGNFTGMAEDIAPSDAWIPSEMANGGTVRRIEAADLTAALPPRDLDTIHDSEFQLLIVTRPSLYDEARRLAEHRQDEGLRVFLASLGSGDWDYVQEAVETWWGGSTVTATGGGVLHTMTALLIFGDTEHIETCPGMIYRGHPRPTDPTLSESIVGTDNRYATLAGDDYIPDVSVGRISVNDETEAAAVVDKIIRYEGQIGLVPPHSMAAYAYFQEEPTPWLELPGSVRFTAGSAVVTGTGTQFTDYFYPSIYSDYIRVQGGYDDYYKWARIDHVDSDTRLELTDVFGGPRSVTATAELGYLDGRDNWEFVKGAERVRQWMLDRGCLVHFGYTRSRGPVPSRAFDGSPLPDDLALGYLWDTTTADIQDRFGQGHDGIVLHCDHGNARGWVNPRYYRDQVVGRDTPLLGYDPIVLSMNCGSGWFDNETDYRAWGDGTDRPDTDTLAGNESFCEVIVRQPNGGAVAAIGAIRGSDAGKNDKLIDGMMGALFWEYEEGSLEGVAHDEFDRLGAAFRWAKLHQRDCISGATYKQYNMEIYHLFGDPMQRLNLPEPAR